MKRKISLIPLLLLFLISPLLSQQNTKTIPVSENIELIQLSDNAYLYISYFQTESWGKVGGNGLLFVKDGKAVLIDTPWDDEQTQELFNWVKDSLQATITTVIPTHWHEDCMGGLNYLHSKGVKSYANQMTIDIAKEKGLPIPQVGFTESLSMKLGNLPVECYYPGGGHSTDNIVVWIPSEKILFGGCAVKDRHATNLGNLSDADVAAWPSTIENIINRFPEAQRIIPGHGSPGGCELMEHTLHLLTQ